MKTSIVLLVLIVINTSALLSEPLAILASKINPWLFIISEILLFIIFFLHQQLKGLHEISKIEINDIELFVFKAKEKTQGKP